MGYNFIASTNFNKALKGLKKRQRKTLEQIFELMQAVTQDPYGPNTKAIKSNSKIGDNILVRRVAFYSKDGNVPYRILIVIHECQTNRQSDIRQFCLKDPFDQCHLNMADCSGLVYFIGLNTRKDADFLYQHCIQIYEEAREA